MLNYRAGLSAAATYNVNRDPKRAPTPLQPLDFFSPQEEHPLGMTDRQILRELNAAYLRTKRKA